MEGYWLGPMPIDSFLRAFLPSTAEKRPPHDANVLQGIASESQEYCRHELFVRAIRKWVPDLVVATTSTHEDPSIEPNVRLYNKTDGEGIELWMEFNHGRNASFQDPAMSDDAAPSEFTPDTKEARQIRAQLAQYAGALHSSQFRHFSFSILVADGYVRFLRWDPAGTIVSTASNYQTDPGTLLEFLWRFNHLSPKQRGYDSSIRRANLKSQVAKRVRMKLGISGESVQLFEYDVPGLETRGHAYGPRPISQNHPLINRDTKSLPVVWIPRPSDSSDEWAVERTIYLKDTWRFLPTSSTTVIAPEHEIYKRLREHHTPNVPALFAGGDVDDGLTHTQEFMGKPWQQMLAKTTPFCHYRIVLGIVGHPLATFRCTKELVSVVLDALQAHKHAFEEVGLLHRDISPGNIIRTDDGQGLLIDWELAKETNETSPDQMGTWQFISANLLLSPRNVHELSDDLESFLHVLGWMMLSFVPAYDRYTPRQRWYDLSAFDERSIVDGVEKGGLRKIYHLIVKNGYPSLAFKPMQHTPLVHLLHTLSEPFGELYRYQRAANYQKDKRLESSDWFIEQIRVALHSPDKWPEDDRAVKLPAPSNP